MSIHTEYLAAKKCGFDRALPLKTRKSALVRAMKLRNQAGEPAHTDGGWINEPKEELVDPIERELERVSRYIENGYEYDPKYRAA